MRFQLPKIVGPVFQYYRLSNFYQNHRLYVKSIVPGQLQGEALSFSQLSDCSPLVGPEPQVIGSDDQPLVYYPCGLIANSFFNDTLSGLTGAETIEFSKSNINWPSDKDKFGASKYSLTQVVAPPYWRERDDVNPDGTYKQLPDLANDADFINWMRTAGLSTFRKLYGRFDGNIEAGSYEIAIRSVFEVKSFNGTKSLVISTVSWLGGKNKFLGVSYLVVGALSLALGFVFLIKHIVSPRKLGDHRYLSWNKVE